MKKVILMSVVAFVIGIGVYNLLPTQTTMHQSGLIPVNSKRDLIDKSDIIIKGNVQELKPSFWSNPNFEKGESVRNIIQTDVLVNVDDVYKNQSYNNEVVTVRINKGTVGDTTSKSDFYPDFEVGEEVVLFLSKDDSELANPNENYYVLTGMIQGKFPLKNKEAKSVDKTFVNKISVEATNDKDTFKLSTLKQEIKDTLADLEKNPIKKMTKEEIKELNEQTLGK
ncbi:hypothetical protein [Bacillus sp. FJAT-28004]|uniref:hypothetical protein n=1 Tax=Bacillus sp. FJAT-28004 TaxID=1679165 RepID=UPI0006B5E27E|nr:hypothetical protein [Bacillus sp. FJAT-28004]